MLDRFGYSLSYYLCLLNYLNDCYLINYYLCVIVAVDLDYLNCCLINVVVGDDDPFVVAANDVGLTVAVDAFDEVVDDVDYDDDDES